VKVTGKATFSEYVSGGHIVNGLPPNPELASITETMIFFHRLLTSLAYKGVKTGTKLQVTIETLPKKKRR
jgi:hypothetical protein